MANDLKAMALDAFVHPLHWGVRLYLNLLIVASSQLTPLELY